MSAAVQRRALEDELRLVLEQKATIEAQLAALRTSSRGGAASKGLKRNSSAVPPKTHVPATKKQKVGLGVLHTSVPVAIHCKGSEAHICMQHGSPKGSQNVAAMEVVRKACTRRMEVYSWMRRWRTGRSASRACGVR